MNNPPSAARDHHLSDSSVSHSGGVESEPPSVGQVNRSTEGMTDEDYFDSDLGKIAYRAASPSVKVSMLRKAKARRAARAIGARLSDGGPILTPGQAVAIERASMP